LPTAHASTAGDLSQVLILRTVRSAARSAGGVPATVEAGAVPASVVALVEGELAMLRAFHQKLAAALLLAGGVMAAGAVSLAQRAEERASPAASQPLSAPAARLAVAAEPEGKAGAKLPLANGGIEEGEKTVPRAWSQGAAIPGVTYIWSRDTAH